MTRIKRWFAWFGWHHPYKSVISIILFVVLGFEIFDGFDHIRSVASWAYTPIKAFHTLSQNVTDISKELNDPDTGLVAISKRAETIQRQVDRTSGFLVGKYPEFGALVLSEAKRAAEDRDISQAVELLKTANVGFQDAQLHKTPTPSDFFVSAIQTLSDIPSSDADVDLRTQIYDLRITLATYGSALRPIPQLTTHGSPTTSKFLIAHLNFDLTHGDGFIANLYPPEQLALKVLDVNVVKGFQQLDGIRWEDVTFVGTQIRYNGGPVELTNVRFINCSFVIPPSPNAASFLDYAALGLTKFTTKNVG